MMKVKYNFKKFALVTVFCLQIAGAGLLFTYPQGVVAQTEIQSLEFVPQVNIPNSDINGRSDVGEYHIGSGMISSDLLARYIKAFYNYGLAIAGILAAIVLMGGGVLWLTSGGDSGKVGKAKELITGSVVGVVILACAWVILNTINPNLISFAPIQTPVIKRIAYCCDATLGNTLMDKDGNCQNGVSCTGDSICQNSAPHDSGKNSFACINTKAYGCCEWRKESDIEKVYCKAVLMTQNCPEPNPDGYKYGTKYPNTWCEPGYFDTDGNIERGCLERKPLCEDSKEGEECSTAGHCYNDICWNGKGAVKEPCGNRGGSKCYAVDDCSQNGNGAIYHDASGASTGRTCGTDLQCCNTKD